MNHPSSSPPTRGPSIQQSRQQQLLSVDKVELVGKGYQDDWKTKVGRGLGADARTQEQATLQQEQDQGVGQMEVRRGEPEAQATPLGRAEELTAPSQNQQSPSIQDSAAMDSMKLLSGDEAEMVEEGCQDDWKTKVWRSFTRFLLQGGYLLGTTPELVPQKKTPLPDPGPSSGQRRRGGAKQRGECGQGAWKSKA